MWNGKTPIYHASIDWATPVRQRHLSLSYVADPPRGFASCLEKVMKRQCGSRRDTMATYLQFSLSLDVRRFGEPCPKWLPISFWQTKRRHLLLEMLGVSEGLQIRISTVDKQLISPTPDHTHPVHRAETTVHVAKQNLKRKASGGDQPTKYLISKAVGGLGYESRSKFGCQLSFLNRMV